MRKRVSPLTAIFLTVFLDMLSFGLAVSDIQLRGERLGASAGVLGLVLALYSIAQLAFSPVLGRISDHVGRRRVLLVTTGLACVAHGLYAFADAIWILGLSRFVAGAAGGNMGVGFAYVSDTTEPEERVKAMGLLGAAFGLGFIFGPPVGAFLVEARGGSPLLLGGAGFSLSLLNLLFVTFGLPESPRKRHAEPGGVGAVRRMAIAMNTPGLRYLLLIFFLSNVAFANQQSTFFLLAENRFHLQQFQASLAMVEVGVVAALMGAWAIRPLVARFGETKLLRFGLMLQAPMLAVMPFSPPWGPLLTAEGLLGVGTGMANPSMSSLISQAAPPSIVGGIFGITMSLGAVARIIGPLLAVPLFYKAQWLPYLLAGMVMLLPAFGSQRVKHPNEGTIESRATVS